MEIEISTGLCIYLTVCLMATLYLTIITAFGIDEETNVLKKAFYIQRAVWMGLDNTINTTGLVIVTIVISLFAWMTNLLVLAVSCLMICASWVWTLFVCVFQKKNKEEGE